MKKMTLLFTVAILLTGCATTDEIYRSNESKVPYENEAQITKQTPAIKIFAIDNVEAPTVFGNPSIIAMKPGLHHIWVSHEGLRPVARVPFCLKAEPNGRYQVRSEEVSRTNTTQKVRIWIQDETTGRSAGYVSRKCNQ